MTHRGPEEPQIVLAQPELTLPGIAELNAVQSVELWLARNDESDEDLNSITAKFYLADSDTRLSRARRSLHVREIDERCMHNWGALVHGGSESV